MAAASSIPFLATHFTSFEKTKDDAWDLLQCSFPTIFQGKPTLRVQKVVLQHFKNIKQAEEYRTKKTTLPFVSIETPSILVLSPLGQRFIPIEIDLNSKAAAHGTAQPTLDKALEEAARIAKEKNLLFFRPQISTWTVSKKPEPDSSQFTFLTIHALRP